MEGWSEEEIRNKSLMAPCGLYCGACGVYIATRDANEKFKSVMGNLYGTKPEDTVCLGCMQPEPPEKLYGYCSMCKIRDCVRSKGFYSCHQCTDWPCEMIENFGFATGRKVMKSTIPVWREKWPSLATKKAAWNGRAQSASAIIVLNAVSLYSVGPKHAATARRKLLRNLTGNFKNKYYNI